MSGSVEAVPPAAARDRSARAGVKGPRKKFRLRVADNSLIGHDPRSKMEGIGGDFWPFLSSRTRPGRAHDASLKSRGARPEANAAFRRVAGFGKIDASRPFLIWIARNPLKSPGSDEGIQGNPSPLPWSGLDGLCFRLEEFGLRRCGVGRSLLARLSTRVNEARRRGRSEIGLGSYSRRQMAPQWLERIEAAPGDGMAPNISKPQDLASGRGGACFVSLSAAG